VKLEAVTEWLHGISGGEQAAARLNAKTSTDKAPVKAATTPTAKPSKMATRERIATQPAAAYPLPDPTAPADALAAALTIGDAAIVTRMAKRAARASGAHS
jgi:hypothetical protein